MITSNLLYNELSRLNNEELKNFALDKELGLFKLGDKNLLQTIVPGQREIIKSLVFPEVKRIMICCCTQYGKSLTVAIACLIISCLFGEVVAVVAPSTDKAKIIMRYYIEHLGDNPIFYSQLEKNTKLERLRQEESKERIILQNGGGIYCLSVQERNTMSSFESAMGMGAKVVILDEACLINDTNEATIFRMIAGKGAEAVYCKIGNPFYSEPPYSHFKIAHEDPEYHKINIDYRQAIQEGRYSQEFIDSARLKPLFEVLYENKFPDSNIIDRLGYRKLIDSSKVQYVEEKEFRKLWVKGDKYNRLGVDIGGGGDPGVFVIRNKIAAFKVSELNTQDTMAYVDEVLRITNEWGIEINQVYIDDLGIGRGVCDRLAELGHSVVGVGFGERALDSETFANVRAECYWNTKLWIEDNSNKLVVNKNWQQLFVIKYKNQSGSGKVILEPKELIRERLKRSPDDADSLALTFYKEEIVSFF